MLSGHLYYVVTDLFGSPTVAATSTALTLSLYARRMFMESSDLPFLTHLRGQIVGEDDRVYEAHVKTFNKARLTTGRTAGWEALGEGGLVSWYGE